MKVLQVIGWSLSASLLSQDFLAPAAFATLVNFREILEEQPGSVEQRQQRPIMVGGKWIKAGFYVGQVLPKKPGHVRVKTAAVWHRRIGTGAWATRSPVPSSRIFRKPTHDQAMADIPGDAGQWVAP